LFQFHPETYGYLTHRNAFLWSVRDICSHLSTDSTITPATSSGCAAYTPVTGDLVMQTRWLTQQPPAVTLADLQTQLELDTGEILSIHHIQPAKNYRRNTQEDPG
jgi:hypothetical protein